MRANYRELPRVFAFMTSMPPPSLRIYIVEVSDPDWAGHNDRVQDIYTNVRIPGNVRFTIYPEHRFHPEKNHANIRLNTHDRNTRNVYNMDWWYTGFMLQNHQHHRDLQDIPLLDFESRLLQDLLFEQGHPVSLINLRGSDDMYNRVLNHRLDILRMFPHSDEVYRYNVNLPNVRRRLSFSLRELERPHRYNRDDIDYHSPDEEEVVVRTPTRRRSRETSRELVVAPRPPRNIIIQPPPAPTPASSPFLLPKFVAQAIVNSHIQGEKTCSITMTPFKDIKDVVITSCYHCFEQEALSRWMIDNQSCPECRKTIDGTSAYRNEENQSTNTQI